MFQRKVDFVKIYAKQSGMSVKEYKAYMQVCIEDMKTDPETRDWFYGMFGNKTPSVDQYFQSCVKAAKKQVKRYKRTIL